MRPVRFDAPPRNILLIKPSSLGDVTHALPVLTALRRKWPEARLTWLVSPACAGLIEGHPHLDEILLFDRRRFGAAWKSLSAARQLLGFHRELAQRRFDLVVDLQGLFRSGWMSRWAGGDVRIGFANARELAWLFYTHRVPVPTMERHAVDRYLSVAEVLGCDAGRAEFVFPQNPGARAAVGEMLGGVGRYALLMPGANWETKRWPAERFGMLVEPLKQRWGLTSVLAGGNDAAAVAEQVGCAVNLAGRTTLPQLVALLEGASLVVANDSGPMHIAAALNRPLVAIFGPTNPVRTGPYGRPECVVREEVECWPCYSRRCSHTSCLRGLGVEKVLEAAERQLATAENEQRRR